LNTKYQINISVLLSNQIAAQYRTVGTLPKLDLLLGHPPHGDLQLAPNTTIIPANNEILPSDGPLAPAISTSQLIDPHPNPLFADYRNMLRRK